jgi:hypothetical protein
MKNITSISSSVSCSGCNLNGYICFTPNGGDYTTCPLCNYGEYGSGREDDERYKMDTIDYEDDEFITYRDMMEKIRTAAYANQLSDLNITYLYIIK